MIEELLTRMLKQYLLDYLDNFDAKNMDISLLKGRVLLENLQLNNKILDGLPVPLKMKYGRIGRIEIKLPRLFELAKV